MADDKKVASKLTSRKRGEMRSRFWPEIDESRLWIRTRNQGFTTLPRTFTLIARILDRLSGKGVPLADTYLTLWCWVFDEAMVEIRNPKEFAFESGFTGARAEATWKSRMRRLEELGFIKSKPGIAGEFQYVLLMNPLHVIRETYEGKEHDEAYNALVSRMLQVGADDFDEL